MRAVFQVKICGITTVADAEMAVAAGADAVGLNFHPASPRCISLQVAAEICDRLRGQVQLVGVFVDRSEDDVRRYVEQLELDIVQLHGDESLELIDQLQPLPVIRSVRCRETGLQEVSRLLQAVRQLGTQPLAMLVDAYVPGPYGGTGEVLDWATMQLEDGAIEGCPLVLAGGLTADNVGQAIAQVQPAAVDTASGVERQPGCKDIQLVQQFVADAKAGFGSMSESDSGPA